MSGRREATKSVVKQSPEEQLAKIYAFMSSQLNDEISTPEEVIESITSLLEDFSSNKKQMKKAQSSLSAKTENEKKLKAKISQLQIEIAEKEATIADTESSLRELQLKNELIERQRDKLEAEIRALKRELRGNTESETIPGTDSAEQVVSLFEELIESQSKEIAQFSQQRELLIQRIHEFDAVVDLMDKELLHERDNCRLQVEQANAKVLTSNKELEQFCSEVNDMVPVECNSHERDSLKYLRDVIENLIDTRQPSVTASAEQEEVTEKYEVLVSQLESAMRLLQGLTNHGARSPCFAPLVLDEPTRTYLLTETARIGRFIDDNYIALNLQESAGVFDPRTFIDVQKELGGLLRYTRDEQLKSSPFRELYALFVGLVEVNHLMFTYVEECKHRAQKALEGRDPAALEEQVRELLKWKEDLMSRMAEAAAAFGAKLTDDDNAFEYIMGLLKEKIGENESLMSEVSSLKDSQSHLESQHLTVKTAKKELKKRKAEYEKAKLEYEDQIEDLKKQIEAKSAEIEQAQQERNEVYRKLKAKRTKLSEAKKVQATNMEIVSEIQAKVSAVESENVRLTRACEQMRSTIKAQNEQLEASMEKEKSLRHAKKQIKARLTESESRNGALLANIKRRNEELGEQYKNVITVLENEIAEVRSQNDRLVQERDTLAHQKADLSNSITKMRLAERALKLKLANLQDKAEMDKAVASARDTTYRTSLQAQLGKQAVDLKSEIDKGKSIVLQLLATNYGISADSERTLENLLNQLADHISITAKNQLLAAEATKCRTILDVPRGRSLTDAVKELLAENTDLAERQDSIQEEISRLRSDSQSLIIADPKNSASAWESWAKSLYYQISGGCAYTDSPSEIRFALEEAFLCSIGHRHILRRLEFLRAEKRLLLRTSPILKKKSKGVPTLRTLLLIAMFCGRVEHHQPV